MIQYAITGSMMVVGVSMLMALYRVLRGPPFPIASWRWTR